MKDELGGKIIKYLARLREETRQLFKRKQL